MSSPTSLVVDTVARMDILRQGDDEPARDVYSDEPVFDLGDMSRRQADETEAEAAAEEIQRSAPASDQLIALFNPQALAIAGVIIAVLTAVTPTFGVWSLVNLGVFDQGPPSRGWTIGPVLAQGAVAVGLGLSSWRLALRTGTEVPRMSGTAVLLGALLLVTGAVLWTYGTTPSR
jgi:hypothetical protein